MSIRHRLAHVIVCSWTALAQTALALVRTGLLEEVRVPMLTLVKRSLEFTVYGAFVANHCDCPRPWARKATWQGKCVRCWKPRGECTHASDLNHVPEHRSAGTSPPRRTNT